MKQIVVKVLRISAFFITFMPVIHLNDSALQRSRCGSLSFG